MGSTWPFPHESLDFIENGSREWEQPHDPNANSNHIGKLHTQPRYQGKDGLWGCGGGEE